MSVPSQCCADGRCSRCARSIVIGFCRAMSGASIAARVMTTTIPIPIRARLSRTSRCRCLGSSMALLSSSGWISQLARRVRRLSFPSAVLPEVLRRYRAYPLLQMLSKSCNDRVDIAVHVTRLRRLDALDHDSIASIRIAQGDDEHDRHVESQGEYRSAARRLCRPPEEWDERRPE